ncbi:coiled-coil domain-containing protein 166-like [Notechis scutatus]|uniref:Coiled-coil domain-containing protein 166-like n=1 Tax=Notechis scutatus TaxID=8663 RepID=A0A6J1VKW1_9SAUR|nr:coiled-coil domain-containing protein 166-like [Notechis scutatus]
MAQQKTKLKVKKSIVKQQSSSEQFFTEREQHLKKEYATLTEYIKDYSDRVDHFQDENELLDKEAQEIQENNKAYLTYLAKRTLLCQNAIITLNDQNRSDLASVLKQKDELTSQYKDREKEVRSQLIEMETKYSLMNKEVDDLRPFKELQSDQLSRIWELEKELLAMKIHHSEQMHTVKNQFLQKKAEYEMESQKRVQALAKKAEKEAVRSLIQHTKQIKAENGRLRNELLNLIKRAQGLKATVHQLQEQKEQLLQELQYGEDLAHVHSWLSQQRRARGRTRLPTRTRVCFPLQLSMNKGPESLTSLQGPAKKQSTTQTQRTPSVGDTKAPIAHTAQRLP